MVVTSGSIPGVKIVDFDVHRDHRGHFAEAYSQRWFDGPAMVQANWTERVAGTVVGLHWHRHQSDLWFVTRGAARIVLHDLRRDDGQTAHIEVRGLAQPRAVFIPPGVAHGFAAHTDVTLHYLIDRCYDPEDEHGVAWNDPKVGARWGVTEPILSERDKKNPPRKTVNI